MRAPNAQRGGPFWSRFLSLRRLSSSILSERIKLLSSIFTRCMEQVFSACLHVDAIATIARSSGGPSELPPRTILRLDGVRVKARKSRDGGRMEEGDGIEPSARVSGNVSCLAGGCRLSGMYSVLVRSLASC